ncbi:unnamed protein product [Rotaria sordida]|uniref:Cyclic nucleotide-binding domain-containing protein n=1 Tax=Rotaria sordida TaxID=392033 RepID=A0A814MY19_9BILA|nr:unnamed protein product [Rotaria sordida]CAF1085693.1 unnamed protein product [Rotaria sordida]
MAGVLDTHNGIHLDISNKYLKVKDVNLTSAELVPVLKSVKILKHLDDKKYLDLADHFKIVKFRRGQHIVQIGRIADRFFILLNGTAGVFKPGKNGQTLDQVSTLNRLDYVGVLDMFFNRRYLATVTANILLSCTEMNIDMFNFWIRPILEDLQSKSEEYNTFKNLDV